CFGTGTKWGKRANNLPPDEINGELVDSILNALRIGFTHIDTAEWYGTEPEETGKPRSSVFITTKIAPPPTNVKESFEKSLKKLGPSWKVWNDLEELVEAKKIRSIGVSNWRIEDFNAILATDPKIKPSVNQIEFHAYSQGLKLRKFVESEAKIGTVVAAYGPLQPLIKFAENGRVQDVVNKIAADKGAEVTGSQVLLAWGWAVGTIQVTTSAKEERLKEAVAALDIVLMKKKLLKFQRLDQIPHVAQVLDDKQFDD
ncbi:Aldo/keto reductase, partial [Rhizoclosmatium globosum]